jgi:6-phosphogluconolactonase
MSAKDVLPDVRVFPDAQALSAAAAAWVADELADGVRARGRASFVLSGGSTPRTLYELLAARFKDRIPWTSVHVFWSDERYVPHDDPLSNYRMAKKALLDQAGIPAAQIYPMPTDSPEPQAAARDYETVVAHYFAGTPPVFDVMLLGIGADGHMASVFPGSSAITSARVVVAVTAPAEPPSRLTLTLPVIASARRIGVLVAGTVKAAALAAALGGEHSELPAAVLARTASTAVWWVDRDAWSGAGLSAVEGVSEGGPR